MRITLIALALILASASSFAKSTPSDRLMERCDLNASSSVESRYGDNYDREGFQTLGCKKSPVGRAVICEVAASKDEGAAIDTFRVVLNMACTKALRIELVGEE